MVFDRPCSKFVVLLLFRLYSCTFVNVDAVNGMSFTLFSGRKGKNVHFDVCIFISPSPLNIMYTVLFHSSVILKENTCNLACFFFFLFVFNPLSEKRPASICTGAVTSTVDSLVSFSFSDV